MKKNILIILNLILIIICTACNNKNSIEETRQPVSNTPTPISEETPEPSPVSEETLTPSPNVNNDRKTEITDTTIINGLSKDILDNMTLEEKVGQLFIVNMEALDDSNGAYYEWREITDKMEQKIEKYNLGGVILFSRNIETREQTSKYISDLQGTSKFPMFISVDEEGGSVSRIASNDNMNTTQFPNMSVAGATEDEEYAYQIGSTIGKEISELGFNLDFAPVADVSNEDADNGIGDRSFGDDPKLVGKMVKNVVAGLQNENVSSVLKHFPGHGEASGDTHSGSANVDKTIDELRKTEFVPFKAGIKAKADFIMVAHVSISRVTEDMVPCSLSALVLNDILRTELEFKGIAITDAMNMGAITDDYTSAKAAVTAIKNGIDIVLMPENFEEAYNGVFEAVKSGEITQKRIDEAVTRILRVKVKRGIIPLNTELINK